MDTEFAGGILEGSRCENGVGMIEIDWARVATLKLEGDCGVGQLDAIERVAETLETLNVPLRPTDLPKNSKGDLAPFSGELFLKVARRRLKSGDGSAGLCPHVMGNVRVRYYFSFDLDPQALQYHMSWRLEMPFGAFQVVPDAEALANDLWDLAKTMQSIGHFQFGDGHSYDEIAGCEDSNRSPLEEKTTVHEMYWLNLYGRDLVDRLGRERVLATPAYRLEELPDGSVLFLTSPTPVEYTSREAREAQAKAFCHLRDDANYDEVLQKLLERSRRMEPAEMQFPSQVADLWERIVDNVGFGDRFEQIRHFNARTLPAVSEWRPATAALPCDVENEAEVIDQYLGFWSEGIVALAHEEVESVLKGTPASLTDLDVYFHRELRPRIFTGWNPDWIDEKLVPALGGYLAMVIVRHLGGRFIPRRNMRECQILLGDRVWFPVERAWQLTRDNEHVLDYSLTQFFREIAAHPSIRNME